MFRKLVCLFFIISFFYAGKAQISFSLQLPPTGILLKKQLWNMTIVNSSAYAIGIRVNINLVSIIDNTPLLTARSKPLQVAPGARQLTANDFTPIMYTYISPSVTDRNPDGFLPIGNFQACYTVSNDDLEIPVELAEDCAPLDIQPIAPPLLNFPEDGALLETRYPQFTWIPPAPLQLFTNLNYDLSIVRVLNGQSVSDAIQQNIPVYNVSNQKSLFVNYPAAYLPLDTAQLYAWRVAAKNNNEFIAQSEAWTFKIRIAKSDSVLLVNNFLTLSNTYAEGVALVNTNDLGIKYYSYDSTFQGIIVFKDDVGNILKEVSKTIYYGDNYLSTSLNSAFKKGIVYTIEIESPRKEKSKIFFKLKP